MKLQEWLSVNAMSPKFQLNKLCSDFKLSASPVTLPNVFVVRYTGSDAEISEIAVELHNTIVDISTWSVKPNAPEKVVDNVTGTETIKPVVRKRI